jgi:hypothetical protein
MRLVNSLLGSIRNAAPVYGEEERRVSVLASQGDGFGEAEWFRGRRLTVSHGARVYQQGAFNVPIAASAEKAAAVIQT